MKIRMSHRIIAMALAFFMVVGMLPTVAFARSAGQDGSAAMNEDYEAKTSLMPIGPSFNVATLLEWTAESDPDAAYARASIPLKERVEGFVVNPLANPEAKLMLCSLANSDHDHTSAQGTESFLSYAFNYWQYVDSFVYWSGSEEGIICCPTGEFTDAAHTNGVPVVATLGFPWGSGTGYVQQVSDFCQKAEDGSFPVADKLIEVMDYYGFDGYFFNQESYGCTQEMANRLNEMIHYMHAKRPDMLISWYDSMIYTGSVSYGDAVNSYNKLWMEDDENGVRGVDEFFMNYNWNSTKIATTISTMKSIGRSQFDAFAGIDVQQNCMDTYFADHLLVDEDGIAKLSLALYCPNSTMGLAADGAAFHEVERTFYTNAKADPTDTSVDVTLSGNSKWAGMSRFFNAKTPITSAPFVTDFNSGHGRGYFVDGVLSRDSEWSYQSNQDVMPTYTWLIHSYGQQKLEGSYDFEDAYNGGSSIKFSGTCDSTNFIRLLSTRVEITEDMIVSMTAKGGLKNAFLVVYIGDENTKSFETCEQLGAMFTSTEGWATAEYPLTGYEGRIIYGIGLEVTGAQTDYEVNVGRIAILDKDRPELTGPSEFLLDEILYKDAYTAEARIQWNKVTGASSYEIYKVHADGTKSLIMETPNTAFYIPTLKRDADETDVTLEILPINRNGERGTGTQFVIDWLYANGDTEEVVAHDFENVALNATVTGVSFENSGEPAYKALDGTAANNSKWCATNMGSGWMTIDIGRQVTVKRWRVEHAEYGGEANNMNTIDFALEYKNENGQWVQVKRIQNNTLAVTDVLLDTPVTAQEWKLQVYDDGSSPWGGIRIYEWQMFESDQFPQTAVVPMQFASAVNAVGANDTFTLKNVPTGVTVKVYNADGALLGEQTASSATVTLTGLDFGTAEAGRVYYTVTATGAAESAKLSAAFEAETAQKSAPAEDVSFVAYSHPGSTTSSNGNDIYTTLTVNGLNAGDVVYVYENGADAEYSKASLPVSEGETSVSIDRILVTRKGGQLTLRVKRVGELLSDAYTVATPAFAEPTATVQVFAQNENGETLTGVRFELVNAKGEVAAQMSTTSDSGAKAEVELGTYTIRNTEAPEGYALAANVKAILRIEGELKVLTITLVEGTTVPTDPVEPTVPTEPPVVTDPSDDSHDIPLEILTVSTGNYEPNGGASEGPAELAVDNNHSTIWHTDWYGTSRDDHWFQFEIDGDYNVDGLRILPRQTGNTNGIITEYDIQVSNDGETFFSIATGTWEADREWKLVQFPDARVKYVRLVALDGVTDNAYVFASAAEIRITGEVYVDPMPPVMEPNDSTWDIPLVDLEVSAGDWERNGGSNEGPAELAVDENTATMWHTDWYGTSRENHWFQFEVNGDYTVCGLRYLPRQTGNYNGTITQYEIQVSDDGETFTTVAEGNWEATTSWKISQFRGVKAKYVRLVAIDAVTDNSYVFASAAEIRLTYLPTQTSSADKTELNALIAACEQVEEGNYTAKTWQAFQKALSRARTIADSPYASQAQVDEAREALAAALAGLKEKVEGEGPMKIFHLDSGRKYFSKDWHIALLNELAAAGYTHLQLAFGNNGLRFVLDDMTIEANGTTYDSDALKEGIRQGNYNYGALTGYYVDGAEYLTEAEMDEILAHAASVGVQILPHLNMPGHMSALLDAMDHIGIENAHFTGRVESDSSVNLENEEALNFMYALTEKYAAYFAERGVQYFHIGADEYANDAYNGNMGFPSMGAALYNKFAEFVNNNAAIVKSHGMTPVAWNDGIYYGSYTAEFDSDIVVTYWSSGWWGYTLAKASSMDAKGHELINTNGDYYFILGKDDRFTTGSTTTHNPDLYTECAGYDITRFMDGSVIDEPLGGMFCVWADYPGAETEQEVAAGVRLVLRAMALRMDGVELDGMNTDVVPGGFNEDGSINGETPEIPETTYTITIAESVGGTVTANAAEAKAGETITLTAVPAEGYHLVAIYVNGIAIEGLEFTMPARNVTITAEFRADVTDEDLDRLAAAAEAAQEAAEAAQAAAEEAQRKAEEALAAAEEAAASAAEDKAAAEAAQAEAAEAVAAAEAAQKAAEDAQKAADEAAAAAEAKDVAAAEAAAEAAKHAQEVAELYQEIAAMKAEMAEYLNDAQKAAEEAEEARKAAEAAELECAKAYALLRLAYAAKNSEHDVEDIVAEAIELINAAETAEEVELILANALEAIENFQPEEKLPFVDVPEDSFYYNAVKWAVRWGITTGTSETTFSPDKVVTRAEAVTFLWRDAGCPEPTSTENPFTDVKEGDFYYKAVLWAVENGITNGMTETTFGPLATANRAQIVTFLWRANGQPTASVENPFSDVKTGDWYCEAVLWAVERGITTGVSADQFGANGLCNRAQIVTFLYRAAVC